MRASSLSIGWIMKSLNVLYINLTKKPLPKMKAALEDYGPRYFRKGGFMVFLPSGVVAHPF
jgi:hypothetical protein